MTARVLPENFNRNDFLKNYWQKKPLLIRATNSDFIDPVTPEELAALACEDEAEARLVQVNPQQSEWTLRHGPFTEADFLSLPASHYSLLVQSVDQWVDDVAAMLADFDFIPGWRVDDIMVSYASDQGNVGPHFDYYDVFLIQGQGQRRWQTGQHCDHTTELQTSSDMKLLQNFQATEEYLLEAGDILYLPPGIAHYGIAEGSALTYSVGFRAPSWAEILGGVVDEVLDELNEGERYTDACPRLPLHRGEIPGDVIDALQQGINKRLGNRQLIRRWFGKTMTEPRYVAQIGTDEVIACHQTLQRQLLGGQQLYPAPGARFAYTIEDQQAELYANGDCIALPSRALCLLQALSDSNPMAPLPDKIIRAVLNDPEVAQLLLKLLNQGSLIIE
ncbi:cupin domain-containing protein [Pseudohongiella spirulinae]|uniref:Cupin n=1 Tax=Pseudohongiella spirulinae TaxID=1249552 RepID=A0A0S2KD40_9GAMM|nr:cupin domain-containing protein [Pseudohongiella spirulinae]ALO46225.1 Cupin [Pseudohongiella spirulinae]